MTGGSSINLFSLCVLKAYLLTAEMWTNNTQQKSHTDKPTDYGK